MQKQSIIFSAFFCFFSILMQAQTDSVWTEKPTVFFSGFVDVYYMYDFDQPVGASRQNFLYNHNRHNEFNVNLALLKLAVSHPKYRANVAFQTGTYANDNYAAEQGVMKNVFEANVGISISKTNKLWIDAGVLPSYIGFESALSIQNPTLTRSLLAENSPYFVSGAKMTYVPNTKWEVAALVMNGWQRIQRVSGNSLPSLGTQLNFKPSKKTTLNWSTFVGTDDPDSTRRLRVFNNFFGTFSCSDKITFIAGFDIGLQQQVKNSTSYDAWLSPVFIAQWHFTDKWKTAFRAEYYHDPRGVIIPTGTPRGFQTTGLSVNLDYCPVSNLALRFEGRWLNSKDEIFRNSFISKYNNLTVGASLALTIDRE